MTFDEILEQVIALLKHQGRVSYGALKMRFEEIDDKYLEVLKEEILYVHESEVQADDRGFTWKVETEKKPVTTSQPDQPEPQPVVEPAEPIQGTSSPVESHTPEAERRQLTVMFCDLVGSTELSGQMDAEDYRAVVREYQKTCTEVIKRFDGYVAQYLGDGLLVYFGFPQSHEDEAQRAVYTGLGILAAMTQLNARLKQDKDIHLALRVGIHTGLVVIGEIGEGNRQEQLALGEVPNVAARIQGLAVQDTVVISADTYRLVQGYFDCDALGEHELRGVSQPMPVYQVLQESGAQSRLDIVSGRGLTPLVGREQEVGLLLERWEQAQNGQGQVVLLSGEAGIGKSRLVEALKGHVSDEPHTRLECRSSPYFTNSALYPIIDMVQRTLRFQTADTPEQKLEKLEENLGQYRLPLEESVQLFAALLSLPVPEDRYPPLNLSPQRQRQKTLEAILAIILKLSERQPVLFILEDLHWGDPTTMELLDLLIDQTPTASTCILLTCRPEFQPTWSHRSYLTEMTINRLSRHQIEQMATQVADGKSLPDEVIEQLVDKTDGVPLYVEEMTKAVLESGVLKETNSHYELVGSIASLSIPATLQDSLMARLDRLVTAKAVAQYASVIGRQFSHELLHAVSQLDEATLQRELGRLVEAELVYQRGLPPHATYTFKHALVQDTAYESLLRSTRQGYHRRIAEVLEEQFPETVEMQPELLAHHYTEAALYDQAVDYWHRAGEQATQHSANREGIGHLTRALDLLPHFPDPTERMHRELNIQVFLAPALIAVYGTPSPEAGRSYERLRELCERSGASSQLVSALLGLCRHYGTQGKLQKTQELQEQLLELTKHIPDSPQRGMTHYALGLNNFFLGKFQQAQTHLTTCQMIYQRQPVPTSHVDAGHDNQAGAQINEALTLWLLGYPEQARHQAEAALTVATQLSHPYSLAFVRLRMLTLEHLLREELTRRQDSIENAIALCTEYGFEHFLTNMQVYDGWIQTINGQHETGLTQLRQHLKDVQGTGTRLWLPHWLALLSEACAHTGECAEAFTRLDEALALVDATGEQIYHAELYRLKGELLLQQSPDNQTEAESCFHQAITIAQNQSAKSWELRASTSLAKLWQQQGKVAEAYDLLAPVYEWFTEGFDTADLIDAKALIDELS